VDNAKLIHRFIGINRSMEREPGWNALLVSAMANRRHKKTPPKRGFFREDSG